MKNKYTPLTFFSNLKKNGLKKALELDASETFDDAKYVHQYGLEGASYMKRDNERFLRNCIKNNSSFPQLVIGASALVYYPFGIGTGYILGILAGLTDIIIGKKSLDNRIFTN